MTVRFGRAWRSGEWTDEVEPRKIEQLGGIRPDEQFVRLAREDKTKALREAARGSLSLVCCCPELGVLEQRRRAPGAALGWPAARR